MEARDKRKRKVPGDERLENFMRWQERVEVIDREGCWGKDSLVEEEEEEEEEKGVGERALALMYLNRIKFLTPPAIRGVPLRQFMFHIYPLLHCYT
jgi:hypothetical protein